MDKLLFKNIVIPLYYNIKGFKGIKFYNELKERDKFTIEELRHIQFKRLKKLIEHCYNNIPYYKNLFKTLNIYPDDIKTLSDYSNLIPKLTKQITRENFENLIDPGIPKNKIYYDSTSGSTGIPLQLARSKNDQDFGFALRYRANAWCGWKYYHKSVWFVSDTRHITALNRIKSRIGLLIKRRLMIDTKNFQKENMFKWVKQIKSYKPEYVYGYSSLLAEFSKFLLENNIQIKGIKGVYSTAEVLTSREIISNAFNAPVYDQYGASEIPCIAHECVNGNMHINIDEVLIEFEDLSSNSNIKKLICTPLYLYGMPLLRYEIEDCAILSEKQCCCGLSYPIMELKVGRISDNIISSKGKIISGVMISWYITDITQDIRQYQLIQEDISHFTMQIVSMKKTTQNEENIKKLLQELLETRNIKIDFKYTDKILPGKNGKYRPIFSKILNSSSKIL